MFPTMGGDAQDDADLCVGQAQVVAHERPRRLAHAEDQLVEELDGEQCEDEEREAAARACAHVCRLLCG
jgi:hypothetical protein